MTRKDRAAAALAALLLLPTATAPAAASNWCGENGVIRFSFAAGPELQPVLHAAPDEHGLTRVDLYVWLTDVEPVALDGEAVLAVGGFEFELEVEGAEAFVQGKEFPGEGINVAQDAWGCIIGLMPDPVLEDGKTFLARYSLLFQGEPENVRFDLRDEAIISCATLEGCPGSNTQALWIGPRESDMLSEIFGAGVQPAWLNPTGAPDLTVVRGTSGWRDVGRCEPRKPR